MSLRAGLLPPLLTLILSLTLLIFVVPQSLVQNQGPFPVDAYHPQAALAAFGDPLWDERFRLPSVNGVVNALVVAANGDVYVGGEFTTAGGAVVNHIARWNGSQWFSLGTGLNGPVNALALASDGTLYVGGAFTTAGTVSTNRIARWNGTTWSALGSGVNDTVNALALTPTGVLYVGGAFTTAGSTPITRIARWDGATWSAVGGGMNGQAVFALALAGDGTLYAGGFFSLAGSTPANNIARWDGSSWAALGSGTNEAVNALALDSRNAVCRGELHNGWPSVGQLYCSLAQWQLVNPGGRSQ